MNDHDQYATIKPLEKQMKIAALSLAALAAAGLAAAAGLYAVPATAGTAAPAHLRTVKPVANGTTSEANASTTLGGSLAGASTRTVKYVDAEDSTVRYTQHGSTVIAHQGGQVVATITQQSLTRQGSNGRFAMTVTVNRPFKLEAQDFVWEDDSPGDQNPPVNSRQVFRVQNGSRTVVLNYKKISGAAAVAWEPGIHTAGVWPVLDPNIDTGKIGALKTSGTGDTSITYHRFGCDATLDAVQEEGSGQALCLNNTGDPNGEVPVSDSGIDLHSVRSAQLAPDVVVTGSVQLGVFLNKQSSGSLDWFQEPASQRRVSVSQLCGFLGSSAGKNTMFRLHLDRNAQVDQIVEVYQS